MFGKMSGFCNLSGSILIVQVNSQRTGCSVINKLTYSTAILVSNLHVFYDNLSVMYQNDYLQPYANISFIQVKPNESDFVRH